MYISLSIIKTSQSILYKEIIAVFSENRTKHVNAFCGNKLELLEVKPGGM